MKTLVYLVCSALIIVSIASCGGTPDRPAPVLTQSQIDAANARAAAAATTPAAPAAQTPEPPQNAAGVWHYTCSNGCAGGAGSAVPCAVCGNTLAHNTTYHDTPAATTPLGATAAGGAAAATTITPPTINPPQAPEPPQNAAGVWHYICTNGCAGGAGSATACAGCGQTLTHNTAYHN